ncbi:MAG: TlpA family protein disulfide reductase [SAR86 cluster bacterium]|jgi:thiol-disulfide isomerase/thioredoxin|uniref:TlpA family protein disulfide reductase n=1 Tax=SAR86 cluster bacterium TaxID=2030880 RepID=A0A937LYM5_9GAMM|nr:TlpA family protein disulfide reductase [SAR86 cluster bacterium]MDG1203305.1 TlpA disulfide reductase family protein [SAR86 cluster bacterium]MDG1721897.1 TlpA disulfide reductase family protein [SAR86 cluster bacterium]|tara:strand:- start:1164 stop:1616 length:453 start_codon:yes stop_codon:yes gene_type:complete
MKNKIISLFCLFFIISCQKPDIDLHNSKDMFSENLKGQWVMINYWADWCPPCLKEMPELVSFASANKDVQVFAFNFDQLDGEDLDYEINKFGVDIPSILTHPRDIWGIESPATLPATYFINPDGEIVQSLFRPQTQESLEDILGSLKEIL